ncbi:T9SS sorting signal type C domain-containing protein [Flavobacterium anhuiense]|uniref:T9SS sorting signal type C domain-containing protein n=1 Tax=Flavobacterium anhuiense TaxID=459526 RepID=UPI002025E68F|nr:T9SS sorting signal type C domain-containing protein [Flavobacterium anhuiense]URM37711.1 T9SS sorting signal type C domain-containing protein [Flavobacterium anhuiense]
MMRKLLYSFLFFISSKSFPKRLSTPSLGLLCVGMFFVVSSNYGQCGFGGSQSGTTQSIIYNRNNVSGNIGAVTFTGVPMGRYVGVNVIQGLTYTINAASNQSFRKRITLYNATSTGTTIGSADASNNNGDATINWTATFTGTLYVRVNNRTSCTSTAGNNSTITVSYTGGNNIFDLPNANAEGTNSWIAHVYDFSDSANVNPLSDTDAFTNGSYLGYFLQSNTVTGNTTSFSQDYGGGLTPTVPFTAAGASQNFYGETFAVRYRMRSTLPAGCYFVAVRGDDGVRLFVDGVKVFDAWIQQGPTQYTNVLVYLNGNSQLVLDYYDKDEANVTDFTISPADDTVNSVNDINTSGPVYRCANGGNTVLDGSSIIYQGANSNPSIKFQWQSSPDNVTWTNINTNGTSENYTVQSTNPGTQTTVYYRRNITGTASNAGSCIYSTPSIAVITSPDSNPVIGATMAGNVNQCPSVTGQVYSVTATNASSYSWTVPAGWTITSGQGTNSITVTTGTAGGTISVTAANGCNKTAVRNLAVTVGANNTMTLNSAASTIAQTVCINNAITNIRYNTTGATGATFSGLPAGVTGTWAANVVNINGIPNTTAGSPFNYTVTLTGGCGTSTATGTITVNPVHTITAGSNQSVCQNNAINPIALTWGGGATGATVTGLPEGVTSSISGNTLTISGAPTVSGIFNYNVTTTGNSCAAATTTGTITAGIGNNTITYNNGNSNSVCVSVDENQTANFTAPAGTYFNTVSFASYGSPTGSCGTFQINYTCHSAVKSQAFTESSLLGNTGTISFMADNANFDDPCVSTFKAYKAVARYSEPICAGTIPGQILGSLPTGNGTYTYLWEMSTTSSTSGFSAAPGTNNNQNYTPTIAVTANTWFRRTVTSGGSCPNVSAVVLIKVNPMPTLTGATQAAAVCSGSAATINLTGLLANSTSTISYTINNVAQIPITSVVATAGGTASFTTPALTFANNGQTLQITGVTTTSATPNCSASFTTNVTLAVNPTPTLTGASQAVPVCTGSAATINLAGLLANSTSTISYTINNVAQTPAASVVATVGGIASFTTPVLTSANNGQTLQITGVITTSATPNCSASFTTNVTLSVNPLPTPTVVKDKDFTCESGGSVTVSNLPANWTINQTGQAIQTLTGTGSSGTISGLVTGNYNFTVTNNTSGCTSNTITININNQTSSTTWNGSNWSNGEPDGSKSAIISSVVPNQPFTIAKPNVDACSLTITVPNGSQVIVPSGVTLTITNAVTSNGRLIFKNNSSLLQTTNVQNSGNIVYERETNIRRFDLTYWSSPVTKAGGFTMHDFSPTTLFDKYFYFNPSSTWVTNMNGTMSMETGNGYSIRGPQEFDTVTPSVFTGTFTGVPNNGDITVAGVTNNGVVTMPIIIDKFFLFGNPYPSAIDVNALLDANLNVLGALYFWTHVTPPQKPSEDNTYRYSSNDYVVYTSTGATNVEGGPAAKPFDGFIAAGQGFIAKPKATQIHFNNGMRVGETHNGQFFKTAKSSNVEKNRVWLNITSNEGAFKQILVGYIQGATNNVDFNYDAATVGGNSFVDFYSINETKKLTIQGRALPFDNADVVPLGYKTTVAGNFTIAIDHGDGFFKTQEVYLEDKITGKVINLRNENYTFSTLVGTFTDRFVLKYTNKTLGTGDFENPENSVLVSVKNKVVSITSSTETIKEVNIFDVGAQLLYSKNKVNSSELQITNLHSSDQVLLVKITLENGATITKKVIYSNL